MLLTVWNESIIEKLGHTIAVEGAGRVNCEILQSNGLTLDERLYLI